MGYSRALRNAGAIAAAFGLVSCGGNTPKQTWSRDEITDIADDSVDASGVRDEIAALQRRVDQLEENANRGPAPVVTPSPRLVTPGATLTIGNGESRPYRDMEACASAREDILAQYREQCRSSGAIACSEPRVICAP